MKHHNRTRKLGRKKDQRNALMKSLACSLIKEEGITTTEAKAKELRPFIEKIVTKGKNDTVASRRLVSSKIGNDTCTKKIFKDIAPKYKETKGGYTRVIKLPLRKGDAAKMARIEFV